MGGMVKARSSAAFDAVVDVVVAAGPEELDVDARPARAKPRQDGGQQSGGDALIGP